MNTKYLIPAREVLPLLLSVILFFFLPGCIPKHVTPVYSFGHVDTVMVVRVGSLNFRKCPSVTCRILKTLHRGEKVIVLQEEGAWVQVQRLVDDAEGWVAVKYLDELEEESPKQSEMIQSSGETSLHDSENTATGEDSVVNEEFAQVEDEMALIQEKVDVTESSNADVEEFPVENVSGQKENPASNFSVGEKESEAVSVEDEFADVVEETAVEGQGKVDSSHIEKELPRDVVLPPISSQGIEEEFAE